MCVEKHVNMRDVPPESVRVTNGVTWSTEGAYPMCYIELVQWQQRVGRGSFQLADTLTKYQYTILLYDIIRSHKE